MLFPNELEAFVAEVTPSLTSDQMLQLFEGATVETRIALVRAVADVGDEAERTRFTTIAQKNLAERYSPIAGNLSNSDEELLIEIGALVPMPRTPLFNLVTGSLFGAEQNIQAVQSAIDYLDIKAKASITFTATENTFLKELYESFSIGGRVSGRPEAAMLAYYYVNGSGQSLEINSAVYETSEIVMDTTQAMLDHIRDIVNPGSTIQLATNDPSFTQSQHIRSVMLINGSRDINTQGYVQSIRLIFAEQGNTRLQRTDNRFTIESTTISTADGVFETTFLIKNTYDFESYTKGDKVTELSLGGQILILPDGLSEYMASGTGVAQVFEYHAQWTINWR